MALQLLRNCIFMLPSVTLPTFQLITNIGLFILDLGILVPRQFSVVIPGLRGAVVGAGNEGVSPSFASVQQYAALLAAQAQMKAQAGKQTSVDHLGSQPPEYMTQSSPQVWLV